MTWIGYIRFFNISFSLFDFSSWQSIFFAKNFLIFILPILWGTLLWIVSNSVYDLISPFKEIGIWKTLAVLVSTEGETRPTIKCVLYLIGSLFPFIFFEIHNSTKQTLFSRFVSAPVFPYISIFTFTLLFYILVWFNFYIHKKIISSISHFEIKYKYYFYKVCLPILIPFFIIVGFVIVPDCFGKVWGVYEIYGTIYSNSSDVIDINILPNKCWRDYSSPNKIHLLMTLKDEVIYIQKDVISPNNEGFVKFFISYLKGEKPTFSLCVISSSQIEIDGNISDNTGKYFP